MTALVWRRAENEFGQAIRLADSAAGQFSIDGNGYGRNRWTVVYPDGDAGHVDTLGEAIAWAEQWLTSATPATPLPTRDELEAGAWRDLARYSGAAALTYLEDAPAGRGPWFVVGAFDVLLETHDYDLALAAFDQAR